MRTQRESRYVAGTVDAVSQRSADRLRRGPEERRSDTIARALAALLMAAGIAHFAIPGTYDAIIPHLLPWSRRVWTYLSGATEVALAVGVVWRRTRRVAATLSAVFFVLVFPANIQMLMDSSSRTAAAIAAVRLPLQLPLIWWAWRVRHQV